MYLTEEKFFQGKPNVGEREKVELVSQRRGGSVGSDRDFERKSLWIESFDRKGIFILIYGE